MAIKSITIYSTVTCPYCKLEKQWLDKNNIQYTSYMVDQDQDKADEMIKKSGQMGVPVTEIILADGKSEIVVGFDKPKLMELIGIKEE
jgi:glutaredoxin